MDWVHCNFCFASPSKTMIPAFYFTSCGHILCNDCIKSGDSNSAQSHQTMGVTCHICHKSAKIIKIGREMKPDVLLFFRKPQDVLQESLRAYQESLKKVTKIIEFQTDHRNRLQKHQRQRIEQLHERCTQQQNRTLELEKAWESQSRTNIPIAYSTLNSSLSSSFNNQSSSFTNPNLSLGSSNHNQMSISSLPYRIPKKLVLSAQQKPTVLASYHSGRSAAHSSSLSMSSSHSSSMFGGRGQVAKGSVYPMAFSRLSNQSNS